MHPEIRQIGPGVCPKCGMTLEPVIPELEEEENPELKNFTQRFWWTLPLTIIVTVLAMGGHALVLFHGPTQNWIELGLAAPVVLWAGWPFYIRGVRSVIQRSPNMWTLIGLGTAAAFLYSVVATLAPDVFPSNFLMDGRIGVYFEAAAVIISLTLLGQMLELKARSQTSVAVKSLLGMVATGKAAGSGVLFRDAAAIENLRNMDTLIVDKTGTLTEGRPAFHSVEALPGFTQDEVLRLAASLDQGSEHPLARAIVDQARAAGLTLSPPETFESASGIGVSGQVEGRRLKLGNTALMQEAGVTTESLQTQAEKLRGDGTSIMYLAVNGALAGLLAVADPIKPTSKLAVECLQADGVKVIMATGDGLTTARSVARQLGIEEVHGEVKPQDKERLVASLQQAGHRVAMAGDGINDAPALARADVGIAMGTGTDVAMNSAQVTLVKGDLLGILRARSLSVATVRNMHQNLAFAFLYNAMGIPLAAGLLYPLTGHLLSPLIAALAMSVSSASVVFNALRLRQGSIN